ncbi:MAG: hypothetical protein M1828_001477 [Chrysothrix sp. TS-e1954]|nr:MAG: hypothetical protein M1828_001477 [Chrysothrix sp. TS-e1954]
MKILTLNFLTCAVKACKNSPSAGFPLHIKDAELESVELEFQPQFIRNILPRIEWPALHSLAHDLGMKVPPGFEEEAEVEAQAEEMDVEEEEEKPETESKQDVDDEALKKLHDLLLETQITSGVLVCPVCAHQYQIKEGIANFLLPPHLV